MKFTYPLGATPLNHAETTQLIPQHITNQQELNEWEQANIIIAEKWFFSRKHRDLLSISFLQKLHKKMFDKVWIWAGSFRKYQTNIGILPSEISTAIKMICDDVMYWNTNHIFSFEEIAVRLHHRLVHIHPFPNGNGRHARLVADAYLFYNALPRFSWGRVNLQNQSETRLNYIQALKEADLGNYQSLYKFVRS